MNTEEQQEHKEQEQIAKTANWKNIYFIKIVCFLMIGILLFSVLQYVFLPKRAPYTKTYDAGKFTGFYEEEKNSIDVLVCSTSHSSKAVLPMELYEQYGIKAYNLSTSIQPIEATYYMLAEALKTQTPKVFVYDVSNLYFSSVEARYWWFVLDDMRFGKNKLALMREYKENTNGGNESSRAMLFPLVRYHTRWKELKEDDFTAFLGNKRYYGKGGQINTSVWAADVTVEEMNLIADELMQSIVKTEYIYDGEKFAEKDEEHILYDIDVPEKNLEWLDKMKALCDENNIQMLAIKVPAIYLPQGYKSTWIEEKCKKSKEICGEHGIPYYDLLYDTDLEIDWENETFDGGGQHLNLYGARKVSTNLGGYLKAHYDLPDERNEQWDKDLASYQKVRKVGMLQMQGDFVMYINMLANEYKDKTILMAVAVDMAGGLNEDDISALRSLGLKADFSDVYNNSYVAVIEKGEVKYEAYSNRQLSHSGIFENSDVDYELYSSGWWTKADVAINVAGKAYAYNNKGLNIVVYDNESGLVIDSVCFETYNEEHTANRNNSKINGFEEAFERYIIEVEDR